jgi:adenylate cyclase
MPDVNVTRRLTTIVAADVAGYSRLMGADEEGTLAALRAHRNDLIDPKITAHGGRVANTAGDSILIEFPSVVEALRCAIDFQRAIFERNRETPQDRRIEFRVGINVGDVMAQDGDLLGDGVNVAARLEGLAEPGGICISRTVRDQVRDRMDIALEDLGEVEVKNIARPVRAFRIAAESGATPPAGRSSLKKWGAIVAAAALLTIIAGGGLWWSQRGVPKTDPAALGDAALSLPDKPSIAVLPFTNMSNDKAQEYFSDGITEDIITDLSKISGLFVVARHSTFAYKGASLDIRNVAKELGVRYVLEGSVRRAGQQVRINAQLIDATTGGHLWADRYDGKLDNVFSLQDDITKKIVTVLAVQLTSSEQVQVVVRETENTDAYDAFLKGWHHYQRQSPESLKEAIMHFKQAVELDPDYSRVYAALSATYWQIKKRFWHYKFGLLQDHDARFKAEAFLEKAKQRPTALSHQVATAMLSQQGRHTEALAEGGQAIGVDPNDADSYVALAGALSLAGNPAKALKLMWQAMRLNPHFPPSYLYELGLAQFGTGNFRSAAETLEKATERNSEDRWSYRLLLASYGHLGRTADAERTIKVIGNSWNNNDPISIRAIAFWYPFKEPADFERLALGLRKANVPD